MKSLLALSVLAIILVAGCAGTPQIPGITQNTTNATPVCQTVTTQVPTTQNVCTNISVTHSVCGIRALKYNTSLETQNNFCVSDSGCTGEQLSACPGCTQASTRCGMIVTNLDPNSSGTWVVGANFTVSNGGFNRAPISQSIGPNDSYTFDFQQMYSLGSPPNSATCDVFIVSAPTVNDCHDETRVQPDCQNVTTYQNVSQQVCQ